MQEKRTLFKHLLQPCDIIWPYQALEIGISIYTRDLGEDALDATVDGADGEDMAAGVRGAPDRDARGVDVGEGLGVGDGVGVIGALETAFIFVSVFPFVLSNHETDKDEDEKSRWQQNTDTRNVPETFRYTCALNMRGHT